MLNVTCTVKIVYSYDFFSGAISYCARFEGRTCYGGSSGILNEEEMLEREDLYRGES